MGAIMGIGVATANSILLVTFANDEREQGKNATEAALSAGFTRIRPVIMTALAMIIGMVPMALGMGEGGEQNAPLGRAVIGDLLLATPTTLFFVPIMYSWLRKKPPVNLDAQIAREAGEMTDAQDGKDKGPSMLGNAGSSKKRLILALLLAGVLVAAALVAGYLPRKATTRATRQRGGQAKNHTAPGQCRAGHASAEY